MSSWKIASAASVAACLLAGSVAAEEQTLSFRLVTTKLSGAVLPAANVEGRSIGAGDYVGVAVFDDGRVAFSDLLYVLSHHGMCPE